MITPPSRVDLHRPLKVHLVGSSASILVEPEHGPRDGGTYGEHLTTLLGDRGVPTVVTQSGRWFSLISDHLPTYERDVRNQFPDVVIMKFGMAESQPGIVPLTLVRHVLTWNRTSRRGATFYRTRLMKPVWRFLRDFQKWGAAHDRGLTHRLSPRRFVLDMTRYISLVRKDCGSFVLVLDIDPPGDRVEFWIPTAQARAAQYNDLIAQVATSFDDGVRLVRAATTLTDPVAELPDGLHRTAASHGDAAVLLADAICDWLGKPTERRT